MRGTTHKSVLSSMKFKYIWQMITWTKDALQSRRNKTLHHLKSLVTSA
jgi:hypothetical protein